MEYKQLKYDAVHKWLRRHFGRANKCEECDTKDAKKYEYSLLKGKKYEKKRENFRQLCTSCHVAYDERMLELTMIKWKSVKGIKANIEVNTLSLKEASRITGISITAISNNLTGRSKKAGGFKWTYA